jgi:iron-sulfur cluster repair protein YtfE (RIC family)
MTITSTSTLRRVLRLRPLAVAVLERESAYKCWAHMDDTLESLCASLSLDSESMVNRLSNLPPVSADTEWNTKPLYYLIDHLTRNHCDFREKDMPSILAMLERERLPAYPDGYVIKLLVQEFRYFQQEFLKHMDEEEAFLFPKILRNEACFRHRELGPEAYKGSVNLYLKLETHKPEMEFKRMITSIGEKLRNQLMNKPTADLTHEMQNALESFAVRLNDHADLETDVLFPRAGRLEQELYESSLPGYSRFAGNH